MGIQIWLQAVSANSGRDQSSDARALLRRACEANGTRLPAALLSLPGLELLQHIWREYRLAVSIAHSGAWVAVALGRERLGLDCEASTRNRDWLAISRSFFSASEADVIAAEPPASRRDLFLEHWVLKEAYLKANWGSLGQDLNRLLRVGQSAVRLDQPAPSADAAWSVWSGRYRDCHLALCSLGPVRPQLRFTVATAAGDVRTLAAGREVRGAFRRVEMPPP